MLLCQRVDGVHWRMDLQTPTKVQLPDIPPGSGVLADERAVLVERYLSSFTVVHQAVVTLRSPHHLLHRRLASLKTFLLLSTKY